MTVLRGVSTGGGRSEIQVLRAFAVLAVLGYHFWPNWFAGGYVGVDVFFAISGYLITAMLVREVERSGRVSLPTFYARRARRLLPSALIVLTAVTGATLLWANRYDWSQFLGEIVASAFYAENWLLAFNSVDYSAVTTPSPVQHYWSLSVEEQFYLLWPLLVVGSAVFSKGSAGRPFRRILRRVLSALFAASLTASVVHTYADSATAFFVTHTRAWEFAAGGLLALAADATKWQRARVALAWAGWGILLAVVVLYSTSTAFPGFWAAIPVGATVLIMWAGLPEIGFRPNGVFRWRPLTFVGDISYSLYLWHWPLVIFAKIIVGGPLTTLMKLGLLAATFVLAWLTTAVVEVPLRTYPRLLKARARWSLVPALVLAILVAGPSLIGLAVLEAEAARQHDLAKALVGKPCFGAAALDPSQECGNTSLDTLTPDPAAAYTDVLIARSRLKRKMPPDQYSGCITEGRDTSLSLCTFGDQQPSMRVLLAGDSHAAQWFPALEEIASSQGWSITTMLKTGCLLTSAVDLSSELGDCAEWNRNARDYLVRADPFDLIVVSGRAVNSRTLYGPTEAAIRGFRDAWEPALKRGSRLVVIRDTPEVGIDMMTCLGAKGPSDDLCTVSQTEGVLSEDLLVEAARGVRHAAAVDLTDLYCQNDVCPGAIGGVTVYRDGSHVTATYVRTVAPYLFERLMTVGKDLRAPWASSLPMTRSGRFER